MCAFCFSHVLLFSSLKKKKFTCSCHPGTLCQPINSRNPLGHVQVQNSLSTCQFACFELYFVTFVQPPGLRFVRTHGLSFNTVVICLCVTLDVPFMQCGRWNLVQVKWKKYVAIQGFFFFEKLQSYTVLFSFLMNKLDQKNGGLQWINVIFIHFNGELDERYNNCFLSRRWLLIYFPPYFLNL